MDFAVTVSSFSTRFHNRYAHVVRHCERTSDLRARSVLRTCRILTNLPEIHLLVPVICRRFSMQRSRLIGFKQVTKAQAVVLSTRHGAASDSRAT
jgi:hypothetical protein